MVNNAKGDAKMVFIIFIGTIITVVFLASIGTTIFSQTNTGIATNLTFTGAAINVSVALEGRELLVVTSVLNDTDIILASLGVVLGTGIVNGVQTVTATINDTAGDLTGSAINATYTFNPDGFVGSGGARSITLLIPIFAALAILVFVIVVAIKEGSLGELMRGDLSSLARRRRE